MKHYKYLFLFVLLAGCFKNPPITSYLPVDTNSPAMEKIINLIVSNTTGEKILRIALLDFEVAENEKQKLIDGIIEIEHSNINIVSIDVQNTNKLEWKNHSLPQKAKILDTDYYITGRYWSINGKRSGIDISLFNIENEALLTSGRIITSKKDITSKENLTPEKDNSLANFQPISVKQPENHKLNIDFHLDKTEYLLGDELTLNFKSNTNCYLYLINIADNGEYTMLLPNRLNRGNYFKANKEYIIPGKNSNFVIRAEEPAGINRIMAIAVAADDDTPVWTQQYVKNQIYKDSTLKRKRGDQKKEPDKKTDEPKQPKDMLSVLGHHLNDLFKSFNQL